MKRLSIAAALVALLVLAILLYAWQIEPRMLGVTRVALPEGEMIVNSSQGGGSKDTWVLADDKRSARP